jgi:hypothetical protein
MRRKLGDALRSFRVLGGDLQWRVLLQVIHKENLAVKYLQAQAKKKNAGPFLALLGKVLPTRVSGDPENPLPPSHTVVIELVSAVKTRRAEG